MDLDIQTGNSARADKTAFQITWRPSGPDLHAGDQLNVHLTEVPTVLVGIEFSLLCRQGASCLATRFAGPATTELRQLLAGAAQ